MRHTQHSMQRSDMLRLHSRQSIRNDQICSRNAPGKAAKTKVRAAVDPLNCTRHAIDDLVGIRAERGIAIQTRPTFTLKDVWVPGEHSYSQLATNLRGVALGAGLGILVGKHTSNATSAMLNVSTQGYTLKYTLKYICLKPHQLRQSAGNKTPGTVTES